MNEIYVNSWMSKNSTQKNCKASKIDNFQRCQIEKKKCHYVLKLKSWETVMIPRYETS